jgi:hypothetical protein
MKRTVSLVLAGAFLCASIAAIAPGCGLLYNYDDFKTDAGGASAGAAGSGGGGMTSSTSGSGGGTGGTTMLGALGAPCSQPAQCESGHCADGVCCNTECAGECETCLGAMAGTGTAGQCSPIPSGQDPDGECNAFDPDVCNGAGQCQCHDGIKNGEEVCADCGPDCSSCSVTWSCGNGCADGGTAMECCADMSCNECANDPTQCNAIEGSTCESNSFGAPQYIWTSKADMGCPTLKRCYLTTCTCTCPDG